VKATSVRRTAGADASSQHQSSGEDADGGDSKQGNCQAQGFASLWRAPGDGVAAEGAALSSCRGLRCEWESEREYKQRCGGLSAVSLAEGEQSEEE
jgi:hypothetical protein